MKMWITGCVFENGCEKRQKVLNLEGKEKMKLEIKFYKCRHCGKIIVVVDDSGTPTICCGEMMEVLKPSQTDGAEEKHIPIIKQNRNVVLVSVGDIPHPMMKEHYIKWIVLMTDRGVQKKYLCPGDLPEAEFVLIDGESIIGSYAYCNLHKLWKNN